MGEYKLVAQLGDEFEIELFDSFEDKMSPTINAIGIIMDKAVESDLWADGEINLYNPEGQIIRTMEAKE